MAIFVIEVGGVWDGRFCLPCGAFKTTGPSFSDARESGSVDKGELQIELSESLSVDAMILNYFNFNKVPTSRT